MSAKRLAAISILTALALFSFFVAAFIPQAVSLKPAEAALSTITFSTAGTFTWTVPAGVTTVTVEVWGGGGRGGTRSTNGAGGGGGGGAYSMKNVSVTPGSSYTVVVGAGSSSTSPGGDSYFISAATVMAKGGNSAGNNIATGATGGQASAGVGTVKYSGGNGANGVAGSYGGGGGSSAGTAANGNNAINASGATAPTGGGKGGNGRSGTQGAGSVGTAPGGGGGGALRTSFGTRSGGRGGSGMVKISYETGTALIVGTVELWDMGDDTVDPAVPPAVTSNISPQMEYNIKIAVSDDNTLGDLVTLKAFVYYDADGVYNASEVPVAGNAQTCAILTWTRATNTLTVDAGDPSSWVANNSSSVFPSLGLKSGVFEFHFLPGKVAVQTIESARWHIHILGTDSTHTATGHTANITMNWYGEIVVNTANVDWGPVSAGLDFADSDPSRETGISFTYICNGNYTVQVKSATTWVGSGASNAILKTDGNPGPNQFSLRADRDDTLSGSVLVPAVYATVSTGTQTVESGTTESANSLWLKLGTPFVTGQYNGSIYYKIASP